MSETNSFQKGDLVVLKSGGPVMTVQDTGQWIRCIWYNETKSDFTINEFLSTTLQAAPQEGILPLKGGGN
jgi:uncharacterized protein YodC (DUF2158 family)